MRWLVAVALSAAVLASGCGSHALPPASTEVVVRSDAERTVDGASQAPLLEGHIQGVVVDPAIHPIVGASVAIPGIARKATTDSGGGFLFTELEPSSYMLVITAAGYLGAHALIEVPSGTLVKVKVILDPGPPTKPYHTVQKFKGFTDVSYTDGSVNFILAGEDLTCRTCAWDVEFDHTARTYLLEAFATSAPESTTFETYAYAKSNFTYAFHEFQKDPLRLELQPAKFGIGTYNLSVIPHSFPAPELSKDYTVFLTAWYNTAPATDWSAAKDP